MKGSIFFRGSRVALPLLLLVQSGCSRSDTSAAGSDAGVTSKASTDGGGSSAAPCTFALPAPPVSIEKTPAADLARAVIPSLDPKTMKARPLAEGPVVDCLDDPAEGDWSGREPTVPAKGHVEVALRQPLSGGREIVWAMTGYPAGACAVEEGFVAIVHLEGAVIVADAVGKWIQSCGKPTRMRVVKMGDEEMYTEDSAFGTGAQRSTTEYLWAVRGKRMVNIGQYEIAADSGGIEDEAHWVYDMKAKTEITADQVVVRENWTWTSTLAVDGGGGPKPRTKLNLRKFALEGGKLKALSPEGPPKMP